MSRHSENQSFTCVHCGDHVTSLSNGSYRNHCPGCLWSRHVDAEAAGDRASTCGGPMAPVHLVQPRGKGIAVRHCCLWCGAGSTNRLAYDDPRQPDSITAIAELQAGGPKMIT